jgi:hypothetical protein
MRFALPAPHRQPVSRARGAQLIYRLVFIFVKNLFAGPQSTSSMMAAAAVRISAVEIYLNI